ncbi:MAG: hypothetical protein KDB14_23805 [Planctomycetales bacterium]|nr:hypothetical protein [Planctomycetales bacterium]
MQQRAVIVLVVSGCLLSLPCSADKPAQSKTERWEIRQLRQWPSPQAHQGVAVDKQAIFAISNREIAQLDKETGDTLRVWRDGKETLDAGKTPATARSLKHLNSGVVIDGKLYCAHSTWPSNPAVNTLEVWDAKSLEHLESLPFPGTEGAINWVDRHNGQWWIVFASYGSQAGRTRLVRYDDQWREQQRWLLPESVLKRMAPNSNSGGVWGPNEKLYLTGHDHLEVYVMELPQHAAASGETRATELVHRATLPAPFAGQGIARDRSDVNVLYGIRRKDKLVMSARLVHAAPPGQSIPSP